MKHGLCSLARNLLIPLLKNMLWIIHQSWQYSRFGEKQARIHVFWFCCEIYGEVLARFCMTFILFSIHSISFKVGHQYFLRLRLRFVSNISFIWSWCKRGVTFSTTCYMNLVWNVKNISDKLGPKTESCDTSVFSETPLGYNWIRVLDIYLLNSCL